MADSLGRDFRDADARLLLPMPVLGLRALAATELEDDELLLLDLRHDLAGDGGPVDGRRADLSLAVLDDGEHIEVIGRAGFEVAIYGYLGWDPAGSSF